MLPLQIKNKRNRNKTNKQKHDLQNTPQQPIHNNPNWKQPEFPSTGKWIYKQYKQINIRILHSNEEKRTINICKKAELHRHYVEQEIPDTKEYKREQKKEKTDWRNVRGNSLG